MSRQWAFVGVVLLGLGAGAAREVGEVALPEGVRSSQLYQNVVGSTLRFLIEQVGGAEGVAPKAAELTKRVAELDVPAG